MKNIAYTLLILLVTLAGCSKEDAQSVSFSVKELQFSRKSAAASVNIIANCPWTIYSESGFVSANPNSGTGNAVVTVTTQANNDYDNRSQQITVRSEDGTSSDILNVLQDAKMGLQLSDIDMLKAEGGEFQIKVSTNDNITSVEVPDWITFTSSRALKDYTYTFEAKPNKSGSPRRDVIRLRGSDSSDYVLVEQDSYNPTSIKLNLTDKAIPVTYKNQRTLSDVVSIPFTMEPEYADLSKITVSSDLRSDCVLSLSDGNLNIQFCDWNLMNGGVKYVRFYSNGKKIGDSAILPVYGELPDFSDVTVFAGQEITLSTLVAADYISVTADKDAVEYLGNKKLKPLKTGKHTVTITHTLTGEEKEMTIDARLYMINAYVSYSYAWGSWWDVEITGEVRGADISNYTSLYVDGNSGIQVPLNKQIAEDSSKTDKVKNVYMFSIIAGNKAEFEKKISKFKFIFSGTIGGEVVTDEVYVSPKRQ